MQNEDHLDRVIIDTSSIVSLCINNQLDELVRWHVVLDITIFSCKEHWEEI